MFPLDLSKDNVTWVTSRISSAAGALGAEAIDLINWLLHFGRVSEKFIVIVADLTDWVANSSSPCVAYRSLMACFLVSLDKRPGVCPIGIGETLRHAIAKLVIRVAGDQAKTVCGSLQLGAGLEAVIEGSTHTVSQRRREIISPAPG